MEETVRIKEVAPEPIETTKVTRLRSIIKDETIEVINETAIDKPVSNE